MLKSKQDKQKRAGFAQNEHARNSAPVQGLDSVAFSKYVREADISLCNEYFLSDSTELKKVGVQCLRLIIGLSLAQD